MEKTINEIKSNLVKAKIKIMKADLNVLEEEMFSKYKEGLSILISFGRFSFLKHKKLIGVKNISEIGVKEDTSHYLKNYVTYIIDNMLLALSDEYERKKYNNNTIKKTESYVNSLLEILDNLKK